MCNTHLWVPSLTKRSTFIWNKPLFQILLAGNGEEFCLCPDRIFNTELCKPPPHGHKNVYRNNMHYIVEWAPLFSYIKFVQRMVTI